MRYAPTIIIILLTLVFVSGCVQQGIETSTTTTLIETTSIGSSTTTTQTPDSKLKEFDIIAKQWEFMPETITVNVNDTVRLNIKSVDVTHGFSLPQFGINEVLEPDKEVNIEFVADKIGTFPFYCSVPCGAGHSSMRGRIIVNRVAD